MVRNQNTMYICKKLNIYINIKKTFIKKLKQIKPKELTGTNRGHISIVCKEKRKTANNFIWKYCEPFIGQLPSICKEC